MSEDKSVLEFRISALIKFLIAATVLLAVLSIGFNIYFHTYNDLAYINSLFDFDSEWNIPTRFASELLFISSVLFFVVYRVKKKMKDKFKLHWLFLAVIFLVMAVDESVSLHEQTSQFLRGSVKDLHFAWVIPGTIFVIVFGIAYLKFFFNLETRWKKLFFLSAAIFISGALIMEIVGNFYQARAGQDNLMYSMLTNFEELLEFSGVILLIYSLSTYLMHLSPTYKIILKEGKSDTKVKKKLGSLEEITIEEN
jgi:hypothetical protein